MKISEMLVEDTVLVNEKITEWREAIKVCGNLLVKKDLVKDQFIDSMIHVVEEMGPYMILVPGIAFFHGEPGENVKQVCMSLVTFEDKVVFDEFEKQEIKCAFAFGAKDSDSHLQVLMQLSELLQDEEFLDLLRNNGDKSDILEMIQKY